MGLQFGPTLGVVCVMVEVYYREESKTCLGFGFGVVDELKCRGDFQAQSARDLV